MTKTKESNADKQFAKDMIEHHQGAVKMSKGYLKKAANAKLQSFAKEVIKAQNPEIEFLQGWLKKNARTE